MVDCRRGIGHDAAENADDLCGSDERPAGISPPFAEVKERSFPQRGGAAPGVVRREFTEIAVGDDLSRSAVLLHDPLEKLQRRGLVPFRSDDLFQDLAFMVDGAPEIAELAVDLYERLIQMPAPLGIGAHMRDPPLSDLGGKHRPEPVAPKPNGLMADVDPALGQKVLDDLFARLRRDAFGGHRVARGGRGGERDETTKPYEFGDPFHLDLRRTLANAVTREENAPGRRAGPGIAWRSPPPGSTSVICSKIG